MTSSLVQGSGTVRRVAPLLALTLLACGCGVGPGASPEDVTARGEALGDGQIVEIVSVNSGEVVDVEGVSQADGARVHQWPDLGAPNQHWRLQGGGDTFQLVSVNSGKCLDVDGVSQADGARVQQWGCWGGENQKWRFHDVGDGSYEITAAHSGRCLDVEGVSKETGAYLQQWSCGGGANQRWTIRAADGAPGGQPGGHPSNGHFVTLLYAVWHDHMMAGSRDGNGNPFYMPNGAPYGAHGAYHWWGTPAFGNGIDDYHFMWNADPEQPNDALIDYHADLLSQAGVDFITIDLSNGEQDLIVKAARAVARRYSQRPRDKTPQIALFVSSESSAQVARDTFYSGQYDPGIWFEYEGKPLILIANAGSPAPTGGALDAFTARHLWGLQDTSDKWSFKLNTDPNGHPGTAFYRNGEPEEMSAAAACQATYMTSPDGRRGRQNGDYFAEQWGYIMSTMPRFVFMTAWNEWGSQNLGDAYSPVFTDTFLTEYSADLEPMRDGHGDHYYQLMKGYIHDFKSR